MQKYESPCLDTNLLCLYIYYGPTDRKLFLASHNFCLNINYMFSISEKGSLLVSEHLELALSLKSASICMVIYLYS
jgi:hypothetical protein